LPISAAAAKRLGSLSEGKGSQAFNTMMRLDVIRDWVLLARRSGYDPEELAKLCAISSSQLRRYFKQHFGRPPQEWLDELRMWHAMELLCDGAQVKHVAVTLGFSGSSHFCNNFKAYHGCTPTECVALYRRRLMERTDDLRDYERLPPWREAEFRLLSRIHRLRVEHTDN
jgi:AraC-like DNA-binding protein